jgi:hypothetical protein
VQKRLTEASSVVSVATSFTQRRRVMPLQQKKSAVDTKVIILEDE